MKKKPVLSFERHAWIGRALGETRDYLTHLYVEVANARGSKFKTQAARSIERALRQLDSARSDLEEEMFLSHPDRADITVYYGCQREGKERLTKEQFERVLVGAHAKEPDEARGEEGSK